MVLNLIENNLNVAIMVHSAGGDDVIEALAQAKSLNLTGFKAIMIKPALSIILNVGNLTKQ